MHQPRIRVLVLDDEPLIGLMLQDYLDELGCDVVGPMTTIEEALAVLAAEGLAVPAGAILDVSLGQDRTSYEVADRLVGLGVRIAFATGHGAEGLKPHYRNYPRIAKPFVFDDIERLVKAWRP